MGLPQGNDLEELILASVSDDEVISRLLDLPPVKALQFALAVTLRIWSSNGTKFKAEENFGPLPPLYSFRDETSLRHKLKERHIKAVKYDDAAVETGIWDEATAGVMGEKFNSERHGIIFDSLRRRMVRQFKTNVLSSFICYMKVVHDFPVGKDSDERESERNKDLAAGVEGLSRVGKYSFWGWDDGSSILFWRWPKYIRREYRDGCELFVKGKLLRFTKKKRMLMEELECEMVKKKTEKVQHRRYITSGTVLSLTIFFRVPKGDSDIHLVYDLTACGLNKAL